jgi:hypothetical protein
MITRDSHVWWFVMGSAIITAVSSRLDLIDPLLPAAHTAAAHALIELMALITGVAAGVMRMSPLPISVEGRADAMRANVQHADAASNAAAVAAVTADVAAKATTVAAKAAEVAVVESAKAADVP